MGVPVEIISIGQQVDLDSGAMLHQLSIRLPDGSTVRATVDEDVVQRVLAVRGEAFTPESSPSPAPAVMPSTPIEFQGLRPDRGGWIECRGVRGGGTNDSYAPRTGARTGAAAQAAATLSNSNRSEERIRVPHRELQWG
jgi:hypothetical protein